MNIGSTATPYVPSPPIPSVVTPLDFKKARRVRSMQVGLSG
jgi:hypothetical protein